MVKSEISAAVVFYKNPISYFSTFIRIQSINGIFGENQFNFQFN